MMENMVSVNCIMFISMPGQTQGRAIALPPVSALASDLASTQHLTFFKTSYFPNHVIDLVYIWYND